MDIGPISPIRAVPRIKPTAAAPDLSRVFEVEYLGQSEDEYTPASRKAVRGLEDEEETLAEDAPDSEVPSEPVGPPPSINFFA